ncbi:hypothetical protein EXU48_14870 [Occultella glacieicola]|uniref:FIMAH domain-containing protein n=1 Tax=Occultella glacieicola TaxID=2518684 RepID=A0ABY2E2F1_9MICO|nr:PQQ-binding-like beta-propeller repeat protein [Occultella glacieicola]TDE92790.1 hypothetical protein EXU48_14870 [Occultella glacieicola]
MRRHALRGPIGALALAMAIGGIGLTGGSSPAAANVTGTDLDVIELGPAIEAVNVRAAAFGELADGTPVAYATSNGEPVTFNVIDLRTGESIESHQVPGEFVAGSVAPAPDGSVYFNTNDPTPGSLHRYVPGAGVELIGERIAGQGWLRDIAVAEDGTAYISTYPDAKLLAYDPATGAIRDYGSVADDATYGYAVEIVGDEIWVGTGPVPHLVAVDPVTGDMREIELPDLDNVNYVLRLEERGDHVFAGLSPRGRFDTLVYDLATQEWIDTIPAVGAAGTTEPASTGLSYFLSGGTALAYDVSTGAVSEFGFSDTDLVERLAAASNTYGIGVVRLDGVETFVALTTSGELLRYPLASADASSVQADILPSSVDIVGFGVGPDGNVYSGAKIGPGLIGRIQQGTHELEVLSGPSQAEGFGSHNGRIVIGDYSGAGVNVGDLDEPWEWGTNPSQIIKLNRGEPYHQDRVWTIASTGDRVALGTIPEPGYNGGSITMLDTETGKFEVHRDVIPGQSIISLVHRDGLLYGGTSVHGGSGTTPVADEAELFIWDVATEAVVWQGSPVPGAAVVNGLTWTPDGHLWGLTEGGVVFEFDPQARELVRSSRVIEEPGSIHPWGNHSSLVYDPARGGFLGTAGWDLFFLDHETLAPQFLRTDRDTHRVVMAGNGHVYCVDTTDVCVIEAPSDGPTDPAGAASALATALAGHIEDGSVAGPLALWLTHAAERAQWHLAADRAAAAIRALDRFLRHLDRPGRPDTLDEAACADLRARTNAVIHLIETDAGT